MLPKVAIVGRPNVGKSSLFNRILGTRLSITDDTPGVTRDRIYAKASWLSQEFYIIDTGGIELKDAPFQMEIKAQVEIAIEEADIIIFVVDARSQLTDDDNFIAKMLYKVKKDVIIAVNKVDDNKYIDNIYDFYALGFEKLVPISTLHGIGMGNLLDELTSLFKEIPEGEEASGIKFSLIGRPNVGKSSLVNAILKENRVIVSNIAGTTRDSIDETFTYEGDDYIIIDTAGLRKRGKIYENLEKYAQIRTVDAIVRSDIVILVLDASTGIIEQDTHIGQYIEMYNKPCIIVVNKWDLVEKETNTMRDFELEVRDKFKYLDYAPIVFLSALTKSRIQTLYPMLKLTYEAYRRKIKTSILNDVIIDAYNMNLPAFFNGGKLKIYYATQIGDMPPTFAIYVNDENYVHFSYKRYLENQIRKNFDFFATPIKIEFRRRD